MHIHVYTVAKATRGLAEYLKNASPLPSCAIAFDSRNKSREFAAVAAEVLAQAGIQVWYYNELTPTPMLSFAVRYLHCSAGIVITASHNPSIYNGYKVYGSDGCQITLEVASQIQTCIATQPMFPYETRRKEGCFPIGGNLHVIQNDVIEAYYNAILSMNMRRPCVPLHVVYSPLNGTGNKPVREILHRLGIMTTVVLEQECPDGDFPTCPYPNPEDAGALHCAALLAQKIHADLFLATDPDCDRVGVGIIIGNGVRLITGNEMGVLLLDYLCKQRIALGTMPKLPVAIKTIVTTEMAAAVAAYYGVEVRNVLTGFKFIGEQIGFLEKGGELERYVFEFEESCGYLSGTSVRDKDTINAAMLICEMAAWYKSQGKTLLDVLKQLYDKYGYYQNRMLSFSFAGTTGMEKMGSLLESIRTQPPRKIAEWCVENIIDYATAPTGLPKSDVLKLHLSGGYTIIVRPSGTEPKLKLYLSGVDKTLSGAQKVLNDLCNACTNWMQQLEKIV